MRKLPLRNAAFTLESFDVNLTGSTFEDALLKHNSFKHSSFEESRFELVRFDGTRMSNVSFENCAIERVSFVNCSIRNGRYAGMSIDGIAVEHMLEAYYAANPDRVSQA